MRRESKRILVASALLALVGIAAACGSNGGTTKACVPNATQACLCPGMTMGVQSCNAAGTGLTTCDCGSGTTSSSSASTSGGHGGSTSASSTSGTGGSGSCGDGIIEPSDHCSDPSSEFYCKKDCQMGTGGAGGAGGACAGHVYYAGMYPTAGGSLAHSVWQSLPNAGGLTSVDAGNAQCQALGIGADHVCEYSELVAAAAAQEPTFMAIPAGTTAWLQRTTTVNVLNFAPVAMGGTPSPPGPGGRCNDWTYATHHIGNGEYVSFATAGAPTFHVVPAPDTTFDPNHPGMYVIPGDFFCGQVNRALLCCFTACM